MESRLIRERKSRRKASFKYTKSKRKTKETIDSLLTLENGIIKGKNRNSIPILLLSFYPKEIVIAVALTGNKQTREAKGH